MTILKKAYEKDNGMVGVKTFEHSCAHGCVHPMRCVKCKYGNYRERQCHVKHNGDEYDDTCWCCVVCGHVWFENEDARSEYEIRPIEG